MLLDINLGNMISNLMDNRDSGNSNRGSMSKGKWGRMSKSQRSSMSNYQRSSMSNS